MTLEECKAAWAAVGHPGTKAERIARNAKWLSFYGYLAGKENVDAPEILPMWCTLPGKLAKGYKTVFIEKWTGRRDAWSDPSDYDNMVASWRRVSSATGIGQ